MCDVTDLRWMLSPIVSLRDSTSAALNGTHTDYCVLQTAVELFIGLFRCKQALFWYQLQAVYVSVSWRYFRMDFEEIWMEHLEKTFMCIVDKMLLSLLLFVLLLSLSTVDQLSVLATAFLGPSYTAIQIIVSVLSTSSGSSGLLLLGAICWKKWNDDTTRLFGINKLDFYGLLGLHRKLSTDSGVLRRGGLRLCPHLVWEKLFRCFITRKRKTCALTC